jgi:trk system potassium uptake protein TrkA
MTDLESTGARVAFYTRVGQGQLPTHDTALQDGDLLHLVIAEQQAADVERLIAEGPEEV